MTKGSFASWPTMPLLWLTVSLAGGCGGGGSDVGSTTAPPASLSLVQTVPAHGATGVDGCGFVSARFSAELDPHSLAGGLVLQTAAGVPLPGAVHTGTDRTTATFVPFSPLQAGTLYRARVTSKLRSALGDSFGREESWTFTAAACGQSGNTYVVAPTGDDANPGTVAAPFRTLQKAVDSVSAGDVIQVRAGTYDRVQIGRRVGTQARWIRLMPYGDGEVVVRGNTAHASVYFYTSACDETSTTTCQPVYWVVDGLTIRGSSNGGGDGNAVKIDTPAVKLINNKLCCAFADVVKLVRTANDVQILNNEIWQDATITVPGGNAQGVDIVGADNAHVAFNYVHDIVTNYPAGSDPGGIGIYAKGNSRNAIFENNRVVNTDSHALMLGQSTDAGRLVDGPFETYDSIVRNNIVVGADWGCLATASSSRPKLYNNSCYDVARTGSSAILVSNESTIGQAAVGVEIKNNIVFAASTNARPLVGVSSDALTAPSELAMESNIYWSSNGNTSFRYGNAYGLSFAQWQAASGTDSTSRRVDPNFANLTDLTLAADSLAIDSGSELPAVAVDFNLDPRPQGAATDIGAYEQ